MAAEQRIVLLSLRPRFATAILEGKKTVELRRVHMLAPAGSLLLLYSSSPMRAIVGTATLDRLQESTPRQLWEEVMSRAAISRGEYDEYYRGARRAFALHLRDVRALPTPSPLAVMRSSAGVSPAQSFRYVTADEASLLAGHRPSTYADALSR